MSFSFNWAGVNIPQASVEPNANIQARSRADGAAWGNALRGYDRYVADRDYAGLLEGYRGDGREARAAALRQELDSLKRRNAEIAAKLGF